MNREIIPGTNADRKCDSQRSSYVTEVIGEQIDLLIAQSHGHTLFCTPLLRAARAGVLSSLLLCERGGVVKQRLLRNLGQPAIVLLHDDDYQSSGPDGWPGVARALRWARAAFIHCAGGEAEHYEAAVRLAVKFRRLVLVESSSAQALNWGAAAAGKVAGAVLTRPGVAHPAPAARGLLQ